MKNFDFTQIHLQIHLMMCQYEIDVIGKGQKWFRKKASIEYDKNMNK